MDTRTITVTVNGETHAADVEPRMHLGDFLRTIAKKTGTSLIVQGGGMVQICSRRGCKGHMLDLSGINF